ncbi:MAG: 3-isopropylmalate dehydratase small subunit [Rhodospirillales bacterium]|jgi:3-isopropylmalate/(R)-2-methylmalate dehydratase small subunit|nr:3-isopropylmalate dehydratase small subunit [Rhodospirillales bacterium]
MRAATGRAWVFGDDIDTDVLAPGIYMKGPIEEMTPHCLEAVDPEFAAGVEAGDVVVAGRNFGMGSSREQAVLVLRDLGVAAVVARSFAGIFFRNALNLGLPALACAEAGRIGAGHRLTVDTEAGDIQNLTTGGRYACEGIPEHLMEMVRDGGLVPHLAKRRGAQGGRG